MISQLDEEVNASIQALNLPKSGKLIKIKFIFVILDLPHLTFGFLFLFLSFFLPFFLSSFLSLFGRTGV
jgi:hypothetical protein